ncbi:UDP-N-acetylglucosamine 1-carboxyvinyltransferase [Candidatus Liberibacter africanus]|uniref:UDP-N-acetylglucosamine 1-carboxyvinyltransferase n=1 Tax=Candidatus Liberibacter africanus PTSAPSY TaxID=1277257 RepID=A0A0G3I3P0_LIBAF|nr:UDP-N-acetylglucosamine 1-carboxyvinyltransferase [Candidatus Liberibacter africanus]AKK20469.1 UDP-N-acetylglucosamine 1-carboxyvinyltransferase [Candidatus Liberibacter africanus PTSAPSY]QTP64186.1 UDP-N-acetylglucosamine 1-carboxyvinyltransferase [Candidatus Liberibacter africanus]
MERIKIIGGNKLNGIIPISGAKNAALPLMIASLLTSETLTLENIPNLADVKLLIRILKSHGVEISSDSGDQDDNYSSTMHFRCPLIVDLTGSYDLVSKMRASFWVIGPLLARAGYARISLPGGCAIGTRPVDLFVDSLKSLGVIIKIDGGYVDARVSSKGLRGTDYTFSKVSVGATQVMMMVACLSSGDTSIHNAACEPEVVDLAYCLNAMGAKISGIGSSTLMIEGVTSLSGTRYKVLPDRIEAGTYAMAVAMTGGDVILKITDSSPLKTVFKVMRQTGVDIDVIDKGIRVRWNGDKLRPVDIVTAPFPGFPTDLQAQFMAMMCCASGVSHITETIFENRFMHVQELVRLGAQISLLGQTARVEGVDLLRGAPVMATDLRASVSLVIAALAAQGETEISRVYHLDRGFESLEKKLSGCGALIQRI